MKTEERQCVSSQKVYRFSSEGGTKMKQLFVIAMLMVLGVAGYTPVAKAQSPDTQAKIASAMSAAPMAIAQDATILDYSPEGGPPFVELRKGSNGWTCYPDWPVSPGNDPQCLDRTWQQWWDAYLAESEPNISSPGVAYMLQGGSDPSNTDPFAMEPAPGEDWVTSLPHVMLLFPGKLDTTLFSTDPYSGEPYVMWAGTPYEHIMMPIQAEPAVAAEVPATLPVTGEEAAQLLAFPFEGLSPHEPVTDTATSIIELMAFPFEGLNQP